MTDTTAELRTRIAEAILRAVNGKPVRYLTLEVAKEVGADPEDVAGVMWQLVEDGALSYGADAVVRLDRPVVASLMAERDAALADLSALRVAVGQLADELDAASRIELDLNAPEMALAVGVISGQNQRKLAQRLRSLLDDKDNPDGLR